MNFIHRALGEGLAPDDFLQAMADIYKEPQVWGELDRYPQYVQDVVYIIDYDTVVQMEGLDACAASPRAERYMRALLNCGADREAEILKRAKELADSDPDYEDEAVDAEMETLCRQTALNQDYESFWGLVRLYIARSRERESEGVPWERKTNPSTPGTASGCGRNF